MSEWVEEFHFWKPKPRSPIGDARAWSLLIPAMFSACGFFAFAVLAFSFTEIRTLPGWFRTGLVIVGAFCLAIGGEIGTLTTTIEIFRKSRQGEAVKWDWIGLVVSLLATLAEFLIAFAMLLGVQAEIWSRPMQLWGPIALGLLSALDSYTNFMETGLYLATYDRRVEQWQKEYNRERKKFETQNGYVVAPVVQPALSLACWCGRQSSPDMDLQAWYEWHLESLHVPEIGQYDSPAHAKNEMEALYAESMKQSAWPFPNLADFVRMMNAARGHDTEA